MTDLTLLKVSNNLVVKIGSNGDQITITNWFASAVYQVDSFAFADGTVKSGAEILAGLPVYENGTTAADTLYGYEGVDIMTGGDGNDTLVGYAGKDTLNGGDGNDNLQGGDGNDLLTGGQGTDTLTGDAGNDILTGGIGNDTLTGGTGNDTFVFNIGDGQDTISVDDIDGTDTLQFGPGIALTDLHLVKSGNDLLINVGTNGDQIKLSLWFHSSYVTYRLDQFSFADGTTLSRNALVQQLPIYGTDSADSMSGEETADHFIAGLGSDTLSGNGGDDILEGGADNDILSGGAGNDIFVFDSVLNAATNKDTISDFISGQDNIRLDKDIFASLTTEGVLSSEYFLANATGVAGDANDYILYNTTSGALFYDADGIGQGVAVQFATLTTKPAITANDFMIAA
jgi:Ca2+-binding RTX toxin-like protein